MAGLISSLPSWERKNVEKKCCSVWGPKVSNVSLSRNCGTKFRSEVFPALEFQTAFAGTPWDTFVPLLDLLDLQLCTLSRFANKIHIEFSFPKVNMEL